MPSSPSLKNESPFLANCLSGFIENRKGLNLMQEGFYRMLVIKFSLSTCTTPNRINLSKGNMISFLANLLKRKTLLLRSIPHFYQIRIAYKFFGRIFCKKSKLFEIIHSYINFVLFLFLVIHFKSIMN